MGTVAEKSGILFSSWDHWADSGGTNAQPWSPHLQAEEELLEGRPVLLDLCLSEQLLLHWQQIWVGKYFFVLQKSNYLSGDTEVIHITAENVKEPRGQFQPRV